MDRKTFIKKSAVLAALASLPKVPAYSSKTIAGEMGMVQYSYAIRWRSDLGVEEYPGFQNALDLLNHCHSIGAGGVQVGIHGWTADFAGKVREQREKYGMYLEGIIQLPQDENDTSRFEKEIMVGKQAGVSVIRTACLSGRRYENFNSMEAFQEFKKNSIQSLEWAEPIVRKHKVRLAVENHKDWRIEEMIDLMNHLDSEWMGVTLDTGNNISFLEDPMDVIESLAPYAFSTHVKDMAFNQYEDGILLSEVPLGEGVVDLKRMVEICRKHNPDIKFNLEMITRDPLKVPCLTDSYWATFDHGSSGRDLARVLKTAQKYDFDLPSISDKNARQKLVFEEENNTNSLEYAKQQLGL